MLTIVAILQFISLKLVGHWQIIGHNDPYHFFLNLFMVSNWGFQKGDSFNSPFWSVSVEISIYIIFALFYRYLNKLWAATLGLFLFVLLQNFDVLTGITGCGKYFFAGVVIYSFLQQKLLIKILGFILLDPYNYSILPFDY
jgi:peptidoglycan/LPS O-acetylase OafA/YrhL